MHICFVCREYPPSLRGGGIASYIKEMAHGLCVLKHKVTVICASDDTKNETVTKDGNLTVIRLQGGDFIIPTVEGYSPWKKLRTFYRYRTYRKRIRKAIEQITNIDIIEVPEYGAEALFLQDLTIPIVVRLHTPTLMDHYTFGTLPFNLYTAKSYWQGMQEFKTIHKAKFITSCSSSLKEWTQKNLEIEGNNIDVIPNPININLASKHLWHPIQQETKTVLYVGTICDWKGCEDLCKAIQLLHVQGQNIKLTMIGKQGAYAQMLKKKYKGEGWLNMKDFIPREKLLHKYTEADLVCLPSWWENFPMTCLEAMMNGAIVLGSSCGGMNEIITNGKDGFLVEPKQPDVLAEKIKELLVIPDATKKEISEQAKKKIEREFSMEKILNKTIQYYEQCIEHNRNTEL